jgi:hypothetical protein
MTVMVPKDTQGHALHSQSMQNIDPKYPGYGLSYDHVMPKDNEIQDVKDHPAKKLPQPLGGGEEPRIKKAKKMIDDSSFFGKGNKKQPVK